MLESTEQINVISLETIIDNLPSAILVINKNSEVLMTNRVASFFAKATKSKLLGLRPGNAFKCANSYDDPRGCGYGPACANCFMRRAVAYTIATHEDQSMIEGEKEFKDKGKRFLRISTRFLCEYDSILVAIEDVTDSNNLEGEKLEKERLRAAIETSDAICHEMNQPLQVISGYIDIYLQMDESAGNFKEEFKIAKEQIGRLREITRKLQHLACYKTVNYINDQQILDINESAKQRNI